MKHNKLTSLIINAMSAMVATAQLKRAAKKRANIRARSKK